MWTAIATCGKQDRSFFYFLHQSISANLTGQKASSLLTDEQFDRQAGPVMASINPQRIVTSIFRVKKPAGEHPPLATEFVATDLISSARKVL